MRTIVIVQARIGSARLRGKSIAPIAGRPMLAHVLERAKRIAGIDRVVLATSDLEQDTPLTWVADECGVAYVRGSEHDVLARYVLAATLFSADVIVRITGDCPFLDPDVCKAVLCDFYDQHDDYDSDIRPLVEFVSNDTTCSGYPDGLDCEVFSSRLLHEADRAIPPLNGRRGDENAETRDREHVTSWMRRTQSQRIVRCQDGDWRHVKLSIDFPEDLARARRIFGFLEVGATSLDATIAAWKLSEGECHGL